DNLPKEKPCQICGPGLEILQGVAARIDLLDSTYIYQLTLGGFALNLSAQKDASPVVDGRGCYTWKDHTKAYINHQINVHKMQAQILLEAVREGEFDMLC
ncbi:hypothetical protein MKX01_008195, partial [Papaver californicum]